MRNLNNKELRNFGFLITFGIPIFFGFIFPFLHGGQFQLWTLYISLIVLIISFLKPMILYFPYKFWMLIGEVLGFINSRLILGLIFFFILFPISIFMKILKYDPLQLKKVNSKTYKKMIYSKKQDFSQIF